MGLQNKGVAEHRTQEWSPRVDGELYPNLLVLYLGSHVTSAGVPNLVQGCLPGVTLPESNRWHVNTSINTHIVYQKMLHRKLVETRSVGEPDLGHTCAVSPSSPNSKGQT